MFHRLLLFTGMRTFPCAACDRLWDVTNTEIKLKKEGKILTNNCEIPFPACAAAFPCWTWTMVNCPTCRSSNRNGTNTATKRLKRDWASLLGWNVLRKRSQKVWMWCKRREAENMSISMLLVIKKASQKRDRAACRCDFTRNSKSTRNAAFGCVCLSTAGCS